MDLLFWLALQRIRGQSWKPMCPSLRFFLSFFSSSYAAIMCFVCKHLIINEHASLPIVALCLTICPRSISSVLIDLLTVLLTNFLCRLYFIFSSINSYRVDELRIYMCSYCFAMVHLARPQEASYLSSILGEMSQANPPLWFPQRGNFFE